MSNKPDVDALRRAIEGGIAQAVKDAGFAAFALVVNITVLPRNGVAVGIDVIELTPDDADTAKAIKESLARIGIYGGSA